MPPNYASDILPNSPTAEPVFAAAERKPAAGPEITRKKTFLPGLDPLRAIAAVSVCLFHFTGGMLPKLVVPATKTAFSQGVLGVIIFFVISGFIIPYSLIGKNHQVKGFFAYMKKRVLRINPPAYVSILLVLGQGLFIAKALHKPAGVIDGLSIGQLAHNLLFTIPFTNYQWINGVFWTLAIEFQFYIFIGLLFVLLFERSVVWFVGLYLGAIALQFAPFLVAAEFFKYSAVFALGGVALFWQQKRITPILFVAGLVLFGGIAYWQLGLYTALTAVATAVAINMVTVSLPGFSFLGKISYSLYLVHATVGTTLEFILIKLFPPTSDALKILLTVACLLLTIAASFVFYQLVERPFMKWAAQNRR